MLGVISLLFLLGTTSVYADLARGKYFTIGHPPLIRTRLDPIINPGKVAGHVHSVVGSSAFSENMNFASATAGQCSTSFIQADMSGYWAPQLYYKYRNGTFYPIQGDGLVAYWKYSFDKPTETFAVVPDDFRMLGGDINRDFYDKTIPSHDAVSFQCIGPGYDKRLGWIPNDFECETIRPQVYFPSCWNGKDSYLPDNSHVAYPSERYEGGPCPTGFQRIPNLFLEAYYKVKDNVPGYEWYPGCLVFSNGDNHGLSYHSDWINGWPKGMLVDAFEKCNLPGTVDGCSVFEASRNQDKSFACSAEGSLIDEVIGLNKPLAALPGNNPVYNPSKSSPDHVKKVNPNYKEPGHIIKVPSDKNGACVRGRCTDYNGPSGSAGVTEEPVEDSEEEAVATSTSTRQAMGVQTVPASSGVLVVSIAAVNNLAQVDEGVKTVTKTVTDHTCPTKAYKRRSRNH